MPRASHASLALDFRHQRPPGGAPALVPVGAIADAATTPVLLVDADAVVVYANRAGAALLGSTPAELVGHPIGPFASRGALGSTALVRAILAHLGKPIPLAAEAHCDPPAPEVAFQVTRVDGGGVLVVATPPTELAAPARLPWFITPRASARVTPADLERRALRLAAITRVQEAITRTALHEVYAEIHRAVASVVDASCFALLLADEQATAFAPQLLVVDGVTTWARALPTPPITDCAASRAYRTRAPIASERPSRAWAALVHGAVREAASELAAPILQGDQALGVLVVQSPHAGAYEADDAELLAMIARLAATAIDNARLFEAQRRERELAEAAAAIARIALSGAVTLPGAAEAILTLLDRVVPTAGKALALTVDRDAGLRYVSASGTSAHAAGLQLPLRESAAAAFLGPDGLVAGPHHPPPGAPPAADQALAEGGLLVPLVARGRLLGVLAVACADGAPLAAEGAEALRRLASSVALAIDVQLLGEEEAKRREREGMLATALATMVHPVFILALDRRILYANAAAVREYGYSPQEFAALSADALVASALAPEADAVAAPHADVQRSERTHRGRDGTLFPVATALSVIRDESGAPVGHVLSVRNLTEERRIAEQLRQNEKLAALGELVAGVAHELNNPLAGVSAFAQLLLEEELSADQLESVRLIKREADRAGGVIRDLLLFARKTDPAASPVDLNELTQLTLRLRGYHLRTAGIAVEADFAPELPPITGDGQKLQQVLLNLLVNAEHAMCESAEKRLVVRTRAGADAVLVEVLDTGSGMSEELKQRIFEPFFTTKPAGVGTGLGLSVSYGIVEAHGGQIGVESAPGRGTRFRITLPVRAPAAPPTLP